MTSMIPKAGTPEWRAHWQRQLEQAQSEPFVWLGSTRHARVRRGDPAEGDDQQGECPDCAAPPGWLHHGDCLHERCPKCAGQARGCSCMAPANDED